MLADWPSVQAHPRIVVLSPLLGISWGIFGLCYAVLARRDWPRWLVAGVSWTATESLKSIGPLAFPWLPLGSSQAMAPFLIQAASWVGCSGISFSVAAVNGAVVDIVRDRLSASGRGLPQISFAPPGEKVGLRGSKSNPGPWFVLFCFLANAVLGGTMLGRKSPVSLPPLRVAIVQPNIPGTERWSGTEYARIFEVHARLSREAVQERPEIVVWPEGALGEGPDQNGDPVSQDVARLVEELGVPILMGFIHEDRLREVSHNSATIVSERGRAIGRYDKERL